MARIAFSMAGEGRGHATRSKTIIDHLIKRQHEVLVFAPEFAFQFLKQVYAKETRIQLEEIPGLMFHYCQKRLNKFKTARHGIIYLSKLPALIGQLSQKLKDQSVDLVITDFEPALPRAATRSNIPWISIDHQHFLVASDLSSLPTPLQRKAWVMGQLVKQYYRRPEKMVVSSFYFPPLKPSYSNVVQTGVLLRDQVAFARPVRGDHVVAYLRRFAKPRILESLSRCGCEVRIYGVGEHASAGNLRFLPISEDGFLEDLRTCQALVSNAGNQLVGEALYLRKPVFVFPEEKNFEQEINARFLQQSSGGMWKYFDEIEPETISNFLHALDAFECDIPRHRLNGNNATLQVIESCLPASQAKVNLPSPPVVATS